MGRSVLIVLLIVIGAVQAYTAEAQVKASPVVPGVSLLLAKERSSMLRHIRYKLSFTIPENQSAPVYGEEEITMDCLRNSMPLQIDFKAGRQQVQQVTVQGQPIPVDLRAEHIVIPSRYLSRGKMRIHISFTAGSRSLNRNPGFLYTLLVPDRARTLFPCFDQPDLKAVFTLTLTIPEAWKALGNAPVKDSSFAGPARTKTYHFLPSDTIPTYLFSFAAGRFFMAVEAPGQRIMHGYYRETDSTKIRLSLDSIFQIQARAIAFMEDYTQIPFPFQKFDFVAIPDFQFGGMEHVGAIQYNAPALFLDGSATRERLNARASLLSHETAHIWFGDLVTMRWFNDVWMKEVFANFMADKIGNTLHPTANYDLKFITVLYPAAYSIDRTSGANPIRQKLDNLQDAGSLYGNIIYNKAPIMMRQLETLMGKVPFRDGLREYLKTYAFGNASWPELISILGKYTTADLKAWNKVWVNETGRPVFNYRLQATDGKIAGLTITQKGEDGSNRSWPQRFSIALVYGDHQEEYLVNMTGKTISVPEVIGRPEPLYILFNANGLGYGVFPVNTKAVSLVSKLSNPVMRASAYINAYENMLDGEGLDATALIRQDLDYLNVEPEELNMGLLLGQIQSIFWHFLRHSTRAVLRGEIERTIWKTMQECLQPNEKKQLFLSYAGIAASKDALDTIYQVWYSRQPPPGVKLSEDDYTMLAGELALRLYPGYGQVLREQAKRIQDPDRKARFQYLQPALSANQVTRDRFFYSLQNPKNRGKESWVIAALGYLHHPLRVAYSEKYLPASLEWLLSIQRTGDVFFPQNWLRASLGNYQTASAVAVVSRFLKAHPGYNPKLKEKILQASDNLFRAKALMK